MTEPDKLAIRNESLKAAGNLFAALAVVIWTAAILQPTLETEGQAVQLRVGNAVAWFAVGLAPILSQHYLLGLTEKEK